MSLGKSSSLQIWLLNQSMDGSTCHNHMLVNVCGSTVVCLFPQFLSEPFMVHSICEVQYSVSLQLDSALEQNFLRLVPFSVTTNNVFNYSMVWSQWCSSSESAYTPYFMRSNLYLFGRSPKIPPWLAPLLMQQILAHQVFCHP